MPDLPLEEAGDLAEACQAEGLALVHLVAPSTTPERLAHIAARAEGFLYLVSRPGTPGPATPCPRTWPSMWPACAARVAVAIGFGISSPAQVRRAASLADGVVVGSAVVERAAQGAEAVGRYVAELRHATRRPA